MSSREIIQQTLDFSGPERVGRSFPPGDFCRSVHTAKTYASEWQKVDEHLWSRTDEWGNTWRRLEDTSKGEVAKGVLVTMDDADSYEFPDFSNAEDYQEVREIRNQNIDKYLLASVPGLAFNIARKLLKLDTYLVALMLDRQRVRRLHDRIDRLVVNMICNYAQAGVDAIFFTEDWGTQSQTFISPQLWRDEFFPRFKMLCTTAHENGIKVFMHSCGKITTIIPDLSKAGVDVLQFDQPTLHGIDTLSGIQDSTRITFWCPVDIQKTLQTRNESIIRDEAREMLDKLWRGRGGFIAGYYSDNASIGLASEVQGWACDEFLIRGLADHYR